MEREEVEFNLTENFLSKFKGKQPKWGPIGYFTYKRTYARLLDKGKTEEYWQTLQRVVEATFLVQKRHCAWWKLPWSEHRSQRSAQEMFRLMWDFKFLPPGRGLANMGTLAMWERGGACLNNCGFVSTLDIHEDFSNPFCWLMDMSMHGVGIGFDTEGAFGKALYVKKPRSNSKEIFEIADTREGWVEAFRRVLDSYVGRDSMPKEFNFEKIRPAGSPILTFGGIAPGPDPLKKLLEKTIHTLDGYAGENAPVDSELIVDLMNFAGEAVVAGGVRRTAEIAFGRLDDESFRTLKSQENIENPDLARWASNNSILAKTGMDYSELAKGSATNGEPGFFWLENAQAYGRMHDGKTFKDHRVRGCNPCGEQSLEPFELCNLVETFPSKHSNCDDYINTLKYAYLYAKTVTLIATHDPRTNAVMFRNRRIGLSQTGIIENINRVGFREHVQWCEEGYQKISAWDQIYSDWLCVPKSIKRTTVKPSGTVSLLPGCTPGIHFPHSEYYTRRVEVNESSDLWKIMQKAGYNIEKSVYKDNTMVVEFPVHEPHFDRSKDEVSIWEQFELAAAMQAKWSDNQVSITITVPPAEARDLPRALSMYEKRLKAVSFLPLRGDKVYKQAPYESITKEQYEESTKKLKKYVLDKVEDTVIEKFCDNDSCLI
jgi:adenosylcobalamin-dependent ribonucleoside-triphosphate reductase